MLIWQSYLKIYGAKYHMITSYTPAPPKQNKNKNKKQKKTNKIKQTKTKHMPVYTLIAWHERCKNDLILSGVFNKEIVIKFEENIPIFHVSKSNSLIFISYGKKCLISPSLLGELTYRLWLIFRPRSNNHSLFVGNGLLITFGQIPTGFTCKLFYYIWRCTDIREIVHDHTGFDPRI